MLVLYLEIGVVILAFGGAAWVGNAIYEVLRYKNKRLGEVLAISVGAFTMFVIGSGLNRLFANIPGIGWEFR